MLFSFTIPTYNYANKLPLALESVLTQPGDDFEIIIVNDGSTDNTTEVMQTYIERYPDIIKYYSQKNQGHAAARNFAASKAQGEYLYTLDADDKLLPNALDVMRNAIKQNPDADLIITQHYSVSESNKRQLKQLPHLSDKKENNFIAYLRKHFSIPHGAHVVKHHVFDKIKYPLNILGREDIVFFSQVLANFKAITANQPTLEVYKHHTSFRNQKNKHFGNLEIVDTLFNPNLITATCMQYKDEFASRIYLSFFRDNYRVKNYRAARKWYWAAIRKKPARLLQWNYFQKFIRSLIHL